MSANPFYAPSTLPFQAPPFDKIQDSDYQPAIEAGMAHQLTEIRSITENPDLPTFENTSFPGKEWPPVGSCDVSVFRGDQRKH